MRPRLDSASASAPTLVERARRHAERGDQRRAMQLLREACFEAETAARLWVLYGMQCVRARRRDEALRALRHALWLREKARDVARARVTRDLIERIENGASDLRRAA